MTHFPLVRSVLAGALLATGSTWLLAQQPEEPQAPPVFRAATELVPVDVAVLDNRRLPVRDLTAADFTILEDGRPRPIETFAFVDLPERVASRDAAWMTDVPADVVTNRALTEEGRLIVILMDRTIPVGMPTLTAREVAIAAVNELGPGDMAALISTSGGVPQNFTSDRGRLLRAINQRDWSSGPSGEVQQIEAGIHQGFEGVFTPLTDGRCLCGLCVPETITRVADALQDVPRRRKSLIFVGSDFVVQAGPQVQQAELGCGQKLEDARETMFAALDRSGLVVHGVDPSGLESVGSPTADNRWAVRGPARVQTMQQNLQRQNNIHVVPDHTGGRTVMNTNAPQARVPDIVRESQSYYLLGFRPSDPDPARPVRSIEVKVNRRNVDVRARRQFAAPVSSLTSTSNDVAARPAAGALNGLLPASQIPLDVHLSTFSTPGATRPTVAVAVGIDGFAPAADAVNRNTPLEVVVAAFDATGRPRASARQTVDLTWPTAGPTAPVRVEALTQLALDPGDYELRVGVENTVSRQVASAFSYVTVPAFPSVPFSLSSIVVGAQPTTSSVPRDALQGLLPLAPTTVRTFKRSAAVSAFMRIYQGPGRNDALAPVAVRVQIVDAQDRVVRDQVLPLTAASFEDGRAADCRIALPVAQLRPGDYLLRLEASMGERVAGRVMRFTVE
jgi:VWFA-related protein